MSIPTEKKFGEIFEIEMDGWCHGLERYPGEIFPGLVHVIAKELKPNIRSAIENGYVFSILDLAEKFSKSAKYVVNQEDMAFSLLVQLPSPLELNPMAQKTLNEIIQPVEQKYGRVIERLRKKWKAELLQAKKVA